MQITAPYKPLDSGPDDEKSASDVAAEYASSTNAGSPLAAETVGQIEQVTSLVTQAMHAGSPPAHSDDEPLEDYMDRFMERLVGKKAEAAAPAQNSPAQAVGSATPEQTVAQAQPREPARAPECTNQMALLRELANQSARNAIAEHDRDNLIQKIRYVLVAAVALSLFSSSLAAMSMLVGLAGSLELAIGTGVVAWCLAGLFFLRFWRLPKRAARSAALE